MIDDLAVLCPFQQYFSHIRILKGSLHCSMKDHSGEAVHQIRNCSKDNLGMVFHISP